MTGRLSRATLDVAAPLAAFVDRVLDEEGVAAGPFWDGFADLLHEFTPRNRELLSVRRELQARIDAFHRQTPGRPDPARYRDFLAEVGYLEPDPGAVPIMTRDVDREIAHIAGPQLVVPISNARFAVNAANARWGSLYDALYGTDAIEPTGRLDAGYDAARGRAVIAEGRRLLDLVAPLTRGSHAAATGYAVRGGRLIVRLTDGESDLRVPSTFVGHRGEAETPSAVLLVHHGLHAEILVDRSGRTGASDVAGIDDIVLESAITTIMDLEDSVAAVDAEDKALVYRNWHDLMRGRLTAEVARGDRSFTRALHADRRYVSPTGGELVLPGRSLMLVRNVGHLMTTDAVRDADGADVFEGLLDAVLTTLGALPDLHGRSPVRNSRTGAMYIVKPKMHGSAEVRFTVDLFRRVEELFSLDVGTLKLGVMDEERRTSANLPAVIAAAAERIVFLNTGFLDRTGDEIRTSLHAGPMARKASMRERPFMTAYETGNVRAALDAGFAGRAQIGKGMWAMPDLMHDMLTQKIAHPLAGASTAWVPSPTAATLHALHYHRVDVAAVQHRLLEAPAPLTTADLLVPPLLESPLSPEDIAEELDENVQSILGYVVRWIDQGVGCSKVPDIHGVALMEDRATLRISSQLLSNWLVHGLISSDDIDESLRRLASVVDRQNGDDPAYEDIATDPPGLALEAARRLIVEGADQPSGYTEPILHEMRRRRKTGEPRKGDS